VICDNALVNGFAADQKPVGVNMVTEVCRTLSLTTVPTPAVPAVAPEPAPLATQTAMFSQIGNRRRFSFF